jgi:hypothetical protein
MIQGLGDGIYCVKLLYGLQNASVNPGVSSKIHDPQCIFAYTVCECALPTVALRLLIALSSACRCLRRSYAMSDHSSNAQVMILRQERAAMTCPAWRREAEREAASSHRSSCRLWFRVQRLLFEGLGICRKGVEGGDGM